MRLILTGRFDQVNRSRLTVDALPLMSKFGEKPGSLFAIFPNIFTDTLRFILTTSLSARELQVFECFGVLSDKLTFIERLLAGPRCDELTGKRFPQFRDFVLTFACSGQVGRPRFEGMGRIRVCTLSLSLLAAEW